MNVWYESRRFIVMVYGVKIRLIMKYKSDKIEDKAAGCRVEFEQQAYGFAVIFYRRNTSTQDKHQDNTQDKHQDNTQDSLQNRILEYCKVPRSKKEITVYMGYKDVKSFAKRYLKPLCEAGELQMTIPNRPSSRNQKYVTVEKKEEK